MRLSEFPNLWEWFCFCNMMLHHAPCHSWLDQDQTSDPNQANQTSSPTIFEIGIEGRDQAFSNGKVMIYETQMVPEAMIPSLGRKPN